MREELRSLRSLQDGNENRGQLFALLSQRSEFLRADDPGFREQFQPVGALGFSPQPTTMSKVAIPVDEIQPFLTS